MTIQGGKLVILQEGRTRKFIKAVVEKTFAAALSQGRPVLYVTERAVFRPLGVYVSGLCQYWGG